MEGYPVVHHMAGGELRRQTMINKLTVALICVCVALAVGLGVTTHRLMEARATIDKQETQLKELYGQVNDLTLQYVGIVKRLQNHGGHE
jgi:peroxiredoxin family protein